MLRFSSSASEMNSPIFLYVAIILKEASFHVLVNDASSFPRPYRIMNRSGLSLYYHQEMLSRSLQVSDSSSCLYLAPFQHVDYALEEPIQPAKLLLGVQGGTFSVYNLNQLGVGQDLLYENSHYLSVLHRGAQNDTDATEPYVLEVPRGTRRVVLARKRPGDRAQLWYLSPTGHVFHEGSSPPHEPGEDLEKRFNKRSLVLDLYALPATGVPSSNCVGWLPPIDSRSKSQFLLAALCITTYSRSRTKYQTWRLDANRSLLNDDNFYVQSFRDLDSGDMLEGLAVLAAKPKPRAVELLSNSFYPTNLRAICSRPGTGRLSVTLENESSLGPTKVIRIDEKRAAESQSDRWSDRCGGKDEIELLTLATEPSAYAVEFFANLPMGMGFSVVTPFAEELVYASLLDIQLQFSQTKCTEQFQLSVKWVQIDTQYFGSNWPILIYSDYHTTARSNVEEVQQGNMLEEGTVIDSSKRLVSAILLGYEKQLQSQWDMQIFDNLSLQINKLVIQAEEMLILKLIQFCKQIFAPPTNLLFNLNTQQSKEADQLKSAIMCNTSLPASDLGDAFGMVYMHRIYVKTAPLKLSVQTAKQLIGPDLIDAKRLMPSLMSFADADLSIKPFTGEHQIDSKLAC
ncbi:Vacuolar protein sorting-associated protein 13D [Cichlidogyrus casuarinus]|uniref:Vacuolar protein sorting-associated protein 13D n=1 Tax=Cichlidogyrus casuarinus TaxID=1844966 RepID=A0ABD2QGC0_9PLAT